MVVSKVCSSSAFSVIREIPDVDGMSIKFNAWNVLGFRKARNLR